MDKLSHRLQSLTIINMYQKISNNCDRLIFIMGIPILIRWYLYIESDTPTPTPTSSALESDHLNGPSLSIQKLYRAVTSIYVHCLYLCFRNDAEDYRLQFDWKFYMLQQSGRLYSERSWLVSAHRKCCYRKIWQNSEALSWRFIAKYIVCNLAYSPSFKFMQI